MGEPLIREDKDEEGYPVVKRQRDTSTYVKITIKIPIYNGKRDWQILRIQITVIEEYFKARYIDFDTKVDRFQFAKHYTATKIMNNWENYQLNVEETICNTQAKYKYYLKGCIKPLE